MSGKLRRDLTGSRFGYLVILRRDDVRGKVKWVAVCDCTKQISVRSDSLLEGRSTSCGCRRNHREATGQSTEWLTWQRARAKCFSKNSRHWHRYGARGVTVCSGWDDYRNFLAIMGRRPSERHTFARIDESLGFWCGSCEECLREKRVLNCVWRSGRKRHDSNLKKRQRSRERYAKNRETCLAQMKAYRLSNADRVRELKRLSREKNREKIALRKKAEYARDREKVAAKAKEYRARKATEIRERRRAAYRRNRDRISARQSEYGRKNREKARARHRAWCAKNRQRVAIYSLNRIHRKRAGRLPGSVGLTAAQWTGILDWFDHRCAYCHRKATKLDRDHVIALSAGGLDEPENIVPCCRSCNGSKGAKKLLLWATRTRSGMFLSSVAA